MQVRLPRAPLATLVVLTLVASVGAYAASAGRLPTTSRVGKIVTLVTGERVVLGTSDTGVATTQIIRAATQGPAAQVKTLTVDGDVYVMPASAQPYLGRYLDIELFNATKLAAANPGNRIPLRITFTPGTTPSLPGVTITSSGAGSATGYVTRSSAKVFGAALADQAITDSTSGWPASSSMFGSVTGIAPDIASSPDVTPQFPQTTMVIKGISHSGGPMRFGFGVLMNMDDGRKFFGFVFMVNGEARASVPLGTYAAIFDDFEFFSDGSATVRELVVTDFVVTGSQSAMIVDARAATAAPSVTTPKATVPQELSTDLTFVDESHHFSLGWGWSLGFPGVRMRLTPAARPTVGTLRMNTRWTSVDPSTPGGGYLFDATFVDQGIAADQARHVPAVSQLGAVDNSYTSDRLLSNGATARFVFVPHSHFAWASFWSTPMPLNRTEYVYAPKGSIVQGLALADYNAWDPGIMQGQASKVIAGSSRTEQWFRAPYVLAVSTFPPSAGFLPCLACTTSRAMTFAFALSDNDPMHSAWVFRGPGRKPIASFSVYRNGDLLLHQRDRLGAVFRIPEGDATYRVVNDLSRVYTGSSLSTFTQTDVTFRSGEGLPAPPSYYCIRGFTCSVMPVLTAHIDLHATSLGTIPLGRATFDVAVGHIAAAAELPITSATAEVRRTGTSTWKPLSMTGIGSNQYQARFKAMAWMDQRGFDVRVSVTDSKGGILVQTTERAFVVAA